MVDNFIRSMQDFLMFFVPGFISLRIKKIYGFQLTQEKFTLSVYAILYSFIIRVIYLGILYLAKWLFPDLLACFSKELKEILRAIAFLSLGGVFGIAIAKFSRSEMKRRFGRLINATYSPEKSAWEVALSTKARLAHVKVLMKNGLIYYGSLGEHTMDPDDPDKELVVYDYFIYRLNDENKAEYIKKEIKKTDIKEEKDKVYINTKDVLSIEVQPRPRREKSQTSQPKTTFVTVLCAISSVLILISVFIDYCISKNPEFTPTRLLEAQWFGWALILIALVAVVCAIKSKYFLTTCISIISAFFILVEGNDFAKYRSLEKAAGIIPVETQIHHGGGFYLLITGSILLLVFSLIGIYGRSGTKTINTIHSGEDASKGNGENNQLPPEEIESDCADYLNDEEISIIEGIEQNALERCKAEKDKKKEEMLQNITVLHDTDSLNDEEVSQIQEIMQNALNRYTIEKNSYKNELLQKMVELSNDDHLIESERLQIQEILQKAVDRHKNEEGIKKDELLESVTKLREEGNLSEEEAQQLQNILKVASERSKTEVAKQDAQTDEENRESDPEA